MGRFRQGNLVISNTEKIIQGADTVLNSNKQLNIASLQIDSGKKITEISNSMVTDSTSSLLTSSAIQQISGVAGTSGTSGVAGTSGSSGTSGPAGTSGVAGTSGSSGTSGLAGTSGTSGTGGAGGASTTQEEINNFDIDDVMTGAENSNVWNLSPTVRFSPTTDGAVFVTFKFSEKWVITSDVNFKLMYTISSADTGDVSLNASFWIVNSTDVPVEGSPDSTVEDEITPGTINQLAITNLTNIKIANALVTTQECVVVMKLWRDVDGVVDNHNGWLEMVKLIAYQV